MTALFFASALAAAYVIVAYPILLELWARFRTKPIRVAPLQPRVSMIIPVRNGAPWIARKLQSALELRYPRERYDILVVSDGSDDGTDAIVERFSGQGVRLARIPRSGKPAALNVGAAQTQGEILFLTDARQALDPDCLLHLASNFSDETVGAVSGDLIVVDGDTQEAKDVGLYWRYERRIRANLSKIDSMLGATGPCYAIRRDLMVELPKDLILDDMYLPLQAFLGGYRLVLEERAKAFDYPTALASEFRRKIRTQAGNYQLLWLCPRLLGPANRMWFHYMSLKIGRLLLPWAMIGLYVSSFGLPAPWNYLIAGGQSIFYLLAALDGRLPERFPLRRLASLARAFATLILAPLFALRIFFVPPQSLWKETKVEETRNLPLL